jgi:hypothetical protein
VSGVVVERLRIILAIVGKDLRQLLGGRLAVLVVILVIVMLVGMFLFINANKEFEKRGVPTWTGPLILPMPEGEEWMRVELSADTYVGVFPLTVTLEAHPYGLEGDIKYEWALTADDEDRVEMPRTITHTFTEEGVHGVYVLARDGSGEAFTSARANILVVPPGEVPLQATFSSSVFEGKAPINVTFSSAVAGGQPPYNFSWDFGDGNTSLEADPVHEFLGEGDRSISLRIEDSEGNWTELRDLTIQLGGEEGGDDIDLGVSLLHLVYGFAALVCVLIVPAAFTGGFKQEMAKGTVRTLLCYPVGVLEVTMAKLLYAAIVGGVLSFIAFYLPVGIIDVPGGTAVAIWLVAFGVTILTVAIGALLATGMPLLTRRMFIRPHSMARLLVVLGFLLTNGIIGGIRSIVGLFSGGGLELGGYDGGALTALSPYHLGGEALSSGLGGSDPFPVLIVVMPALLLALGVFMTSRVYPEVFEKE